MIGRADELQRLRRLLGATEPQVAVVAGEPGVGKSRLVHELISLVSPNQRVLIGQADPGDLGRPFELLLDALDSVSPDAASGLQAAIADPANGPVERLRAGLECVRAADAAVVVFEDLHWADSESVALFERLGDLPGNRLLLGTYRPGEVNRRNPAADLLTRLERRYPVTHIRLERLGLDDTSALLTAMTGRPPPYRAAVALQNRTGGNPFFLEELVKAAGGGELDLRKLSMDPLPWNLADALRRQLDELDHTQERVIEAAAVLGRKVPFDLLAVVTGLAEDDLIEVLRELVRRDLLVEMGDDLFGFRHALAREAISDQLLGRQRRRLHELAFENLCADESADLALIAHHAKGAGRYDDMVDAVRRGVKKYLTMGSAFQALQLAEMGLGEMPQDLQLLMVAARSAWLAGLLDDANRHAKQALRVATTATERSGAQRLLARIAWEAGRREDMIQLTDDLIETIRELPDEHEKAAAMAAVAQSFMLRDVTADALEWADHAIELAERLDLPAIRLTALVEKGSAQVNNAALVDEGRVLLREVAAEAEKAGAWLAAARALNNLLSTPFPFSADDQRALLERMRTAAEKAGFDALAVAAYYQGRATLAMVDGDLTGAIAAIDDGRRRDQGTLRTSQGEDYHGAFRAGLALEAGDVELADSIARRLLESASAARTKMRPGLAGLAFHVAARRGDRAATGRLFTTVLRSSEGRKLWGDFVHDLVSAGLSAGLPPVELRRLTGYMSGTPDGWRSLVQAQLAEAEHRPRIALPDYQRAMMAADLPAAARGTAHVGAARCLLALDRRDEATAVLQPAAQLLARWGGWRVAELADVRDRLGIRANASTMDTVLTPRELEVARLLAEGLTNAELARRLFISPRTAAVHVSNILSKLNLTSRTQVADKLGV
jgi:DNA-binding CsgD family transcriptional regulator